MVEQTIPQLAQAAWLDGIEVSASTNLQRYRLAESESYYCKIIDLNPSDPIAHNNLGWTRQMQDDKEAAVMSYRRALQLNPNLQITRRNLATLLVRLGRQEESLPLWHEILSETNGLEWIQNLISIAMRSRDLRLAGEYAAIFTELRWASPWYPYPRKSSAFPLPFQPPNVYCTIPKLMHDIEQFKFLQQKGVLGNEFTTIIEHYQFMIERLATLGNNVRIPLNAEDRKIIGHVYNRIVHIRYTPRLHDKLWGKWDPMHVENQYTSKANGLVVVDDFLSEEALKNVRLFCLESTIWSANRYAYGRLGAFFQDGFNCPLLLQIAERLRETIPRIITNRYPLRQLWGFKNDQNLPAGSTTHADFAAVNVNFWITPQDANLDANSGGLIVYNVDAPLSWDFKTYNYRKDIIDSFLEGKRASFMNIPYRQNRAIIFNSDLFHASAGLRFKPGYKNRRINITMLYGDRENDLHHPNLSDKSLSNGFEVGATSWRSAAFSRVRM
jgi:tetratricopeptide (TPR) repeat protein